MSAAGSGSSTGGCGMAKRYHSNLILFEVGLPPVWMVRAVSCGPSRVGCVKSAKTHLSSAMVRRRGLDAPYSSARHSPHPTLGIMGTGERYLLEAFDGMTNESEAVRAVLLFLNKSFRGRFLQVESEVGVIGRKN